MPVLFIGHGNPLNAINDSPFAQKWQAVGKALPTPRAIVVMSAHWLTEGTYMTVQAQPELIYDFYGFPEELYHASYPVHGSEELYKELQAYAPAILPNETRGLDHGVWTMLMHLFPLPHTIPVTALSIDSSRSPREQYALIEKLKPLRDDGILFIGSGNIVHNLGTMRTGEPWPWATAFDTLTKKFIEERNIEALMDPRALGETGKLAVPTDEHYRPMLNTLALLDAHDRIEFFNEEIDLGSIGMRSFIGG